MFLRVSFFFSISFPTFLPRVQLAIELSVANLARKGPPCLLLILGKRQFFLMTPPAKISLSVHTPKKPFPPLSSRSGSATGYLRGVMT